MISPGHPWPGTRLLKTVFQQPANACGPARRLGVCQICDVVHEIRSSSARLRLVPMPVKGEAEDALC